MNVEELQDLLDSPNVIESLDGGPKNDSIDGIEVDLADEGDSEEVDLIELKPSQDSDPELTIIGQESFIPDLVDEQVDLRDQQSSEGDQISDKIIRLEDKISIVENKIDNFNDVSAIISGDSINNDMRTEMIQNIVSNTLFPQEQVSNEMTVNELITEYITQSFGSTPDNIIQQNVNNMLNEFYNIAESSIKQIRNEVVFNNESSDDLSLITNQTITNRLDDNSQQVFQSVENTQTVERIQELVRQMNSLLPVENTTQMDAISELFSSENYSQNLQQSVINEGDLTFVSSTPSLSNVSNFNNNVTQVNQSNDPSGSNDIVISPSDMVPSDTQDEQSVFPDEGPLNISRSDDIKRSDLIESDGAGEIAVAKTAVAAFKMAQLALNELENNQLDDQFYEQFSTGRSEPETGLSV